MKAVNITWDTDGHKIDLPNEVEFPSNIKDDDFDAMDNYLSDTYGYCVESYDVEY